MTDEPQRQARIRDIARRMQAFNLDEVRALDRVMMSIEILHVCSGDQRWLRRLPTTDRDVDRSFHIVASDSEAVATKCNGSWLMTDRSEGHKNPPFSDRCRACWGRAVAADWLGGRIIDIADELELFDRRNQEKRGHQ